MMDSTIEKRLSDLEHRHDMTRDYVITLASAMIAALAVALFDDHVKPASGVYTDIIVFLISYAVVKRLICLSMSP